MDLDEVLRGLYSQNKIEILTVINTAYHASLENCPTAGKCIHTGFYCKTHLGRTIGFIYCIDNKSLYFQRGSDEPYPLGAYMQPSQSAVGYSRWFVLQKPHKHNLQYPYIHCKSYNIDNNVLFVDIVNSISKNDQLYYTMNGCNSSWKYFQIIKNEISFPFYLRTPEIHTLYCGGEGKFRLK